MQKTHVIRNRCIPFTLVIAACLCACDANPAPDAEVQAASAPVPYTCGRGGSLQTAVFGAISAEIDWDAKEVACEGMPRPNGEGARLRFAGSVAEPDQSVAFIIALPELEPGETGKEFATNATMILEGAGRFFSTAMQDACWTDVIRQEPLDEDRYAIRGVMYCIAPLSEVNGDTSVTIEELSFSGLLDWSSK